MRPSAACPECVKLRQAHTTLRQEHERLRQYCATMRNEQEALQQKHRDHALRQRLLEDKLARAEHEAISARQEVERLRTSTGDARHDAASTQQLSHALEEARARIRHLEQSLVTAGELKEMNAKLSAELSASQSAIRKVRSLEDQLASSRQRDKNIYLLEEQNVSLQHRVERLDRVQAELDSLRAEHATLLTEREQWYAALQRTGMESPKSIAQKLAELQQAKDLLCREKTELQAQISSFESERAEFHARNESQTVQLASAQELAESLQRELSGCKSRCAALTREKQSLQDVLESYTQDLDSESALAVAQQRVVQQDRELTRLRAAQQQHARVVIDLNAVADALRADNARLTSELEAARRSPEAPPAQGGETAEHAAVPVPTEPRRTKILHLTANPAKAAYESAQNAEKDQLRSENERLRLEVLAWQGDPTAQAAKKSRECDELAEVNRTLKKSISELEVRLDRLRSVFAQKTQEFVEACSTLTGYRIEMIADHKFRLRPQYALNDDYLLFLSTPTGFQLLDTPLAQSLSKEIDAYLSRCGSIPAFLGELTLKLFGQRTFL